MEKFFDTLLADYGFLTLVPLLVMLILVATTKKVFESILISTALVYILEGGEKFIFRIENAIYDVFAAGTYPWIVLMLSLFGGLIALLIKSGGIAAFKRFATKYVKSEKSSLVLTWILGLILFIDDYINNLGLGPTMRGITDKYKVPREQLGFTICCMGTPICALVPVTAFAVFVYSVMEENGVVTEGANMLTEYLKVVPFMFYPIVIIIIALLLSLGALPRVGAFKKYYNQLKAGTYKLSESEEEELKEGGGEDDIDVNDKNANIIDFVTPVLVIVVTMLITKNLVFSVVLALVLAFILYIPRKKMNITEYFEEFFEGIKDMIFILAVILMTFVFVEGLNAIGFQEYVTATVKPILTGGAIPALTFITVGIIAFLGVDYWAVMLLIAPISIPLAIDFSVSPYVTVAAIVSGSVFGGTACFFAEQMLMCSQAVQRPTVRLAVGGLPYSISGGIITIGLYLVFGFLL
ncbi:MAG: TRAP transporter large permease subunit [Clostridiales Family XIII bacterium]|jgi:Na+/H+ antiporter NhaC|nr:TRAP transporter large permease subunit [Clostridiales Family XIII bacterium]